MLVTEYRKGRFYLVDSATLRDDEHFDSFATYAEARAAAGARYDASYLPPTPEELSDWANDEDLTRDVWS